MGLPITNFARISTTWNSIAGMFTRSYDGLVFPIVPIVPTAPAILYWSASFAAQTRRDRKHDAGRGERRHTRNNALRASLGPCAHALV